MDKLLTSGNGGFPIVLDDWRWSDEAIRALLHAQYSPFTYGTNENFIISGCEVSAGIDVAAGYVYLNDEVLRYEGDTGLAAPSLGYYVYEKQTTYDSSGDKTMLDGSTYQAYQKNRAILVDSATVPTTKLDYLTYKRIASIWQSIPVQAGYANYLWKVRLNLMTRTVSMTGYFNNGVLSGFINDDLVGTLPVEHRPIDTVKVRLADVTGAVNDNYLRILTNGEIRWTHSNYNTSDAEYCGHITFAVN